MIKANAKTEHKINGQMGHPAAWMMDNKTVPWKRIETQKRLIMADAADQRTTSLGFGLV